MQLIVKSLQRGCMVKKYKRLAIYNIYYLNKVYAKQILFEVNMANDVANSALYDILSLFGIPTTTLQELWQQHCEQKISESRDILFSEIEQGSFDNIGNDDKVSIMHRYMQAAMNGSARINLRLLAKAINGLSKGEKQSKPIYANEFNRYAQVLETLSVEEIQILAKLYKMREDQKKYIKENQTPPPGIKGNYAERFLINLEFIDSLSREKTMAFLSFMVLSSFLHLVFVFRYL